MKIKIPELLCPAGDLTRLCAAVDFGADAVYLAGEEFGMRTAASNFGKDELKKGIEYAHSHGVKVHVTCNTLPAQCGNTALAGIFGIFRQHRYGRRYCGGYRHYVLC